MTKREIKSAPQKAPERLYAIHRRKAARNAWYWRVNFTRRGTHAKTFYDLQHGGRTGHSLPPP